MWRRAGSVIISSVNICGGFLVTKKMLDMFKRPDDPPEFYSLYAIPAGGFAAAYAVGHAAGYEHLSSVTGLASGLCCIGGIAGLSDMKTARLGNVLGMTGVGLGIAATVGEMPNSLVPQFLACSAVGGGAGYAIAQRVGVTELPQTVAAFHSLVGFLRARSDVLAGWDTFKGCAWLICLSVSSDMDVTMPLLMRLRAEYVAPARAVRGGAGSAGGCTRLPGRRGGGRGARRRGPRGA